MLLSLGEGRQPSRTVRQCGKLHPKCCTRQSGSAILVPATLPRGNDDGMGAWGYLPFENDDALDWLDELEGGGADVVRGALAKAASGYVEVPEGSIAIAAADITAACQGNPSGDLPENVAA
jgi:hypothetical protein